MKYFKKMIGERCYLSPVNLEDVEKFTEWFNDEEVVENLQFAVQNIGLNSQKNMLEMLSKKHWYAIINKYDDKLLGDCGLVSIDHLHRVGEIGICIGNKKFWNQGYGEEALRLLLSYSFNYLNLRNIMLEVYSTNERAINCYKKLGFKEIGRRRNAILLKQKEHDIVFMDLLNDEFKE